MTRVAVLHPNDGTDVRISKICRSLSRLGYETHFIGWDRRPNWKKEIDLGSTRLHILKLETDYGRFQFRGYLHFITYAIRALARIRPDVVHAVNEDMAFWLLPFKGFLFRWLICDVFDALHDRYDGPDTNIGISNTLRLVSRCVRQRADRLIATDALRYERFGRHKTKTVIIENMPDVPVAAIKNLVPRGPITIWVGGSLSKRRGLAQLLAAVEDVQDVKILSAGWLYDSFAETVFVNHPRVEFLGIITPKEALQCAASSDAVFAFYAPDSTNNRYASPNKLYDALAVGRPIIMNCEVKLSEFITRHNVGWVCPYEDIIGLRMIISGLKSFRDGLSEFAIRAQDLFLGLGGWPEMERRLDNLYRSLVSPESQ